MAGKLLVLTGHCSSARGCAGLDLPSWSFFGYTAIAESLLRMLVLPRALGRLLPSYVLDRLVTNPFFGYLGMGAPASVDAMTIAIGGLYGALFALGTALLVARQDL